MTWKLEDLERLTGENFPDQSATEQSIIDLCTFISKAPVDFIEALIGSPFGRVYKLFLQKCCKQDPIREEAIELRTNLSQDLKVCGLSEPAGHRTLIALMPLYPIGSMKVEDAKAKLPDWLFDIYSNRYEPQTELNSTQNDKNTEGFDDRKFINRMLGLSNLYYIDPEDKEILSELKDVRLQCAKLLQKTESHALSQYFSGDLGDRYWAMAQCGLQNEALDSREEEVRNELQTWLSNTPNSLNVEGGIQRFAAVVLFSKPGSIQLANPEKNLPQWFADGFKRYNSMGM